MAVIEVRNFKSEVKFDLRGHFQDVVAFEAEKGTNHIGNTLTDKYVIEASDFKSEVRFDPRS